MANTQTTIVNTTLNDVCERHASVIEQFPNSQEDHPLRLIAICANTCAYMTSSNTRGKIVEILDLVSRILSTQWTNSLLSTESLSVTTRPSWTLDNVSQDCINLCTLVDQVLVPLRHMYSDDLPSTTTNYCVLSFEIWKRDPAMIQHEEAQQDCKIQTYE